MLKLTFSICVLLLSLYSYQVQAEEPVPSGFNWDNWAKAVNTNPCRWFVDSELAELLGSGVQSKATESASSSSCQFTAADGTLLLTAAVRSMPSSNELQHEFTAQKNQIEQYGAKRFEYVTTANNAVTAIMRNDKLWLSIFANSSSETVMLHFNGHPVMRQSPEQKTERKTRLLKFADAVFAKFSF
ncbi:MAG: hypothetical protein KKE30_19085 [Gammaproteobacteria bacterium]|nr:hypothetical protein [Gammaproteobacteria bacterium]MBU1555651.1 hypothetical protein [Gammaproteobacteria bacterium]MBU2068723.1 hypothetical protein [Gammaproteobacteria bacterium]MBU2185170.1 hypothetical protein [Gammaproteobacteria bacterium]MBU2205402.1 hypothetical protein [Gammaproteobacteria bacterium]